MRIANRPVLRLNRWFTKLTAIVAATAQLAFAFLPFVEGRLGAGAGPHVEVSAAGKHYAHDEARCVACQAQAVHAILQLHVPQLTQHAHLAGVSVLAPTPVEWAEHFSLHSRAPPLLS